MPAARTGAAPPRSERSVAMLGVVFASLIGSFLVTTCVTQQTSEEIDSLSDRIVNNAMPSIERLAALRGAALDAELELSQYLAEPRAGRPALRTDLERASAALDDEARRYLELATFEGEERYRQEVDDAWRRLSEAVARGRRHADAGDDAAAMGVLSGEVDAAAVKVAEAALRAIRFNAETCRTMAARIRADRRRTVWVENGLTAGCVALGIAGALLLIREERRWRALRDERARSLEARAAELEQFAGRVAHDLRGPITTMKLAADVALEKHPDDATGALARRVVKGVGRAEAIIAGLLEFARSGARRDPGARCDVREVLRDLAASMHEELAASRIELSVEPVPPVLVACSTGVYLSLVSNLVRNAVKYMDEREPRRIVVRVVDEGPLVRTEVADTGPGIAAQSLPALFEPWFRAERRGDGLGLGLATVKKLAEGHDGRAGVESTVGEGSRFWFTLPREGSVAEASS